MAKTVQVTLTKNVRLHGKRHVIGSTVEVDEQVLGQLRKHKAFDEKSITEDKQTANETTEDAAIDGDTNGDGYLTVEEIKALLDAREVDYKGVRKRDELLALLNESEEGE